MKNGKISSFTDLIVWQEGHNLVIMIYKITKNFPREETYSLIDQMRRAASSITANIAEGFGRQTFKEKVQFYYMAKGSLSELRNFLYIAHDVKYINSVEFEKLLEKSVQVEQLLNRFIEKSKTYISDKSINQKSNNQKSINR